ncbi:dephospho-CoA kinase [Bergeyella zoohelcum]|uniref:Dephospho-CoA kinase n=1 Tax=Bergeyella zoohelcum TaxID=1015 RepID=A0A7Z8YQ89_9FLAO|nr:dephospho-CoA kinase [Bergeyella zoohelcum]VDH04781.1 dephospho-CoA kinase [Bergeyella zoohelcum]
MKDIHALKPLLIGITGGIGSGKTTFAKCIEKHGFPVYYSDTRAKEIVNENNVLKRKIIQLLGEDAYDENGCYHRKWVAEKVFGNAELLSQLNSIIHPAVGLDFEEWFSVQKARFVFKETALLFELGLNKNCYKSILVTAEDNIRIKRVMDRDGKTYREVEAIIAQQMPEKEKIKKADFVVYNNSSIEELKKQTAVLIEKMVDSILI